jgi:phosphoglycerate dehydrogenase-like enzyme
MHKRPSAPAAYVLAKMSEMVIRLVVLPAQAPQAPQTPDQVSWLTDSEKLDMTRRSARAAGIAQAAHAAGATVTAQVSEANSIVWLAMGDPAPLIEILDANPQINWVQLPWAGVENFLQGGLFDRSTNFTCAKGAYGTQVAEHALMLMLSLMRHTVSQARHNSWQVIEPDSLFGKRVTIVGAGGIATELLKLLAPFGVTTTIVRKQNVSVVGASSTRTIDDLHDVLPTTDVLVLALSLTPETTMIIGKDELALLPDSAYVINVARGGHIDHDALADALNNAMLAGAGLDVTAPEPLPDDSPLWQMDNVLITSHCADSYAYVSDQLAKRVADNVAALHAEQPLIGLVNKSAGY